MRKNMQYVDFATYAIACAFVYVLNLSYNRYPYNCTVYSVHCWPRKYSMSRFYSADTLLPYTVSDKIVAQGS